MADLHEYLPITKTSCRYLFRLLSSPLAIPCSFAILLLSIAILSTVIRYSAREFELSPNSNSGKSVDIGAVSCYYSPIDGIILSAPLFTIRLSCTHKRVDLDGFDSTVVDGWPNSQTSADLNRSVRRPTVQLRLAC